MIRFSLFATLFSLVSCPLAQAQFGPAVTTVGNLANPFRFAVADLNNDGREDLVCTTQDNETIWFYPRAVNGPFLSPTSLAILPAGVWAIELVDINGDQRLDVLMGTETNLHWAENLGMGNFAPSATLLVNPASSYEFATGDFDGDGVVDVFTSGFMDDRNMHLGLGGGSFASPIALSMIDGFIHDIHVMDLDGDATLDLIFGLRDAETWKVEVDAMGIPIETPLGLFGSENFASGDMDGDGDQDLVRSSFLIGALGWYENQGGVLGNLRTSAGILPSFSSPAVGDMDGDGDLDIIAGGDLFSQLVWVENQGGMTLGDQIVIGNPGSVSGVALLDFNGDGALDILVNDRMSGTIVRHTNVHTIGVSICTSLQNSATAGAVLVARGTVATEYNRVKLQLQDAPPHQFAMLINSQNPGNVIPVGSMGVMCLGGPYGRHRGPGEFGMTSSAGQRLFTLDLPNTPTMLGSTAIISGETWLFQAWFRDRNPGPTSNFSDAVSLTFN